MANACCVTLCAGQSDGALRSRFCEPRPQRVTALASVRVLQVCAMPSCHSHTPLR